MATAHNPAAPTVRSGVQPLRAGAGSSFLWHKLHSLLGIVPLGAFLLEHLLSNFEALKGPAAYGAQVRFLNSLPMVRVLEWVFIFLPLLYHACYGVWIWLRGKSNIVYYPWAGNWLYVAQRYTGLIAFAYIAQHVIRQRFMGVSLPEHPMAAFAKVQQELANPWMLAVYAIAMIAICFHFAYGVWLFAAKWGIAAGATAPALRLAVRGFRRAAGGGRDLEHLGVHRPEVCQCAGRSGGEGAEIREQRSEIRFGSGARQTGREDRKSHSGPSVVSPKFIEKQPQIPIRLRLLRNLRSGQAFDFVYRPTTPATKTCRWGFRFAANSAQDDKSIYYTNFGDRTLDVLC